MSTGFLLLAADRSFWYDDLLIGNAGFLREPGLLRVANEVGAATAVVTGIQRKLQAKEPTSATESAATLLSLSFFGGRHRALYYRCLLGELVVAWISALITRRQTGIQRIAERSQLDRRPKGTCRGWRTRVRALLHREGTVTIGCFAGKEPGSSVTTMYLSKECRPWTLPIIS